MERRGFFGAVASTVAGLLGLSVKGLAVDWSKPEWLPSQDLRTCYRVTVKNGFFHREVIRFFQAEPNDIVQFDGDASLFRIHGKPWQYESGIWCLVGSPITGAEAFPIFRAAFDTLRMKPGDVVSIGDGFTYEAPKG